LWWLQESFSKSKFRATSLNPEHFLREVNAAKDLRDFDTRIRGPIVGYKGASRLFRNISCDAFLSQIDTPLLVVTTKDDTITDFNFVPVNELCSNSNVIFASLERGGHCNLWF